MKRDRGRYTEVYGVRLQCLTCWTAAEGGSTEIAGQSEIWEMRNARDNGLAAASEETDGSRRLDQGGG